MKDPKPFKFSTFHDQFYIADSLSVNNVHWEEKADDARISVNRDIIGVTMNTDETKVEGILNVLENARRSPDLTQFNHVAEADIELSSGIVQLRSCPSNSVELTVQLTPSRYRARIYSTPNNKDGVLCFECMIELWPVTVRQPVTILKR